jgi:hypothetical protein
VRIVRAGREGVFAIIFHETVYATPVRNSSGGYFFARKTSGSPTLRRQDSQFGWLPPSEVEH